MQPGSGPPPPQPALPIRLKGKGTSLIFDWGQETGGFTTLRFGDSSDSSQSLSMAYSESSLYWVGGDHSNGGRGPDGTISTGHILPHSNYTPAVEHMRGGFRYLNLILETDGWVDVELPLVHFTATPNMKNPSAWSNHFYSSDDLLNRIWYGCGYTVQMCSIDPKHGRMWPPPASGWDNAATCGLGTSVLVDGAKRDRVIWPGDMGVSSLTAIATTGDLDATRNSAATLFAHQLPNGMLPYAGPPVSYYGKSDTYHLWALLGTYNVAMHDSEGGIAWLKQVWGGFQRGVAASVAKVSTKGLLHVDETADWQRHGQGGENCPANMLLYRVLTAAAELAAALGNVTVAESYTFQAGALKAAIFAHLWDESKGAFYDNTNNHKLHPQDGNSLAVWFNVTSREQAQRVSGYLQTNWGSFGSSSPEWDGNIGTFSGSMEVHAHMAAGQVARAHALIRLQWGYMLESNRSTHSTFWEGYNADGSFNFQGIYMSNAHGWATGPASALTMHTVGIQALEVGGSTYSVAPLFGDLDHCRGRLSFGRHRYVDAAWSMSSDPGDAHHQTLVLTVDSSAHPGSNGRVVVDLASLEGRGSRQISISSVALNGARVWEQGAGMSREQGTGYSSLLVRADVGVVEVADVPSQPRFELKLELVPVSHGTVTLARSPWTLSLPGSS